MIELKKVSKTFGGHTVIDDLSLTIEDGELVVFVGPSGCGKTTLLKMLNKLVEPSAGEILINGQNIQEIDSTRLRRKMGYVIQQTGLFVHMTVEQNISIILQLEKMKKTDIQQRTNALLRMVDLEPEEYVDRYPLQLSGGQLQRVGVARAFATDPVIVLMDEPFSALDPIVKAQLQLELKSLHAKLKKTIVFVTHDMEEAIRIADRICILNKGRVEQYDTTEKILTQPASEYVRKFIGERRIWRYPQFLTVRYITNTKDPLPDSSLLVEEAQVFDIDTNLAEILPEIESSANRWFLVEENGNRVGFFRSGDIIKSFFVHTGAAVDV